MPKNQSFRATTGLSVDQIRSAFSEVLRSADVSAAAADPLKGATSLSLVASQVHAPFKKPKFGAGLAAVRVDVSDDGSARTIDITAFGSSFGDNLSGAIAVRNESLMDRAAAGKAMPNLRSSKNMAEALIAAVR